MQFRSVLREQSGFFSDLLVRTGDFALFIGEFFKRFWRRPFEGRELINQMDEAGTKSFALTAVTGFAIGIVLAMQSRGTLARFGAEAVLPNMLALSVFKEIGPVIAFLGSRINSYMTGANVNVDGGSDFT